jgi:hypothetical protein
MGRSIVESTIWSSELHELECDCRFREWRAEIGGKPAGTKGVRRPAGALR